jgi:glycosyltransferase involved in cell wall biosynthesis
MLLQKSKTRRFKTETATVPLVSIVIPTYNCAYLATAVQTALDQTYPNTEVVVVDDGSTKNLEVIDPYLSCVRYFRQRNGGTGSALNTAIAHARGEYITWLSSDDRYEANKVARQLKFMTERGATVSYTGWRYIDSAGNHLGDVDNPNLPTRFRFLRAMRRGCHINGCTVMLPRRVFNELGGFDVSLRTTQDYDFWLRVAMRYDFHYLDEKLVSYRVHENMTTRRCADAINAEVAFVQRRHRWGLYREMGKTLLRHPFSW